MQVSQPHARPHPLFPLPLGPPAAPTNPSAAGVYRVLQHCVGPAETLWGCRRPRQSGPSRALRAQPPVAASLAARCMLCVGHAVGSGRTRPSDVMMKEDDEGGTREGDLERRHCNLPIFRSGNRGARQPGPEDPCANPFPISCFARLARLARLCQQGHDVKANAHFVCWYRFRHR